MRALSISQTVIACFALVGVTIAALVGSVSGDSLVAIYGTVLGFSLGYVNGTKTTANKIHAQVREVSEALTADTELMPRNRRRTDRGRRDDRHG